MWKLLRRSEPPKPASAPARVTSPWHAVSIMSKGRGCDAMQSLIETRFLAREAPRLPLGECAVSGSCTCSYRHHEDRRGSSRRREGHFDVQAQTSAVERRRLPGRRKSDLPASMR